MKKVSKHVKKQIFNILFLLLLIGITFVVLLLNYQELNFKNIGDFIKASNPYLLALSVVCMLAGIVFEALSLHVIARKMGHKGKFVSSLAYSTADIYYSAITPSATGGQPASGYYMVKDGMTAGCATFTLVFNVIVYTLALVILSIFALILRPAMFSAMDWFPKFLIILGIVIQILLALFFIACMFFHRAVLKVGNAFITLFAKMHIIKKKKEDKWRNKLADEVKKYRICVGEIKKQRLLFIEVLLFNLGQRVVRVLISCCICLAYSPDLSFWDIFALQTFLIVGYTSIPLPGGVGAFEYLYPKLYGLVIGDTAVIMSAMMVMRVVSYYLSMIITAIYTLIYHAYVMRRKKVPVPVSETTQVPDIPVTLNYTRDEEDEETPAEENTAETADKSAEPAEENAETADENQENIKPEELTDE